MPAVDESEVEECGCGLPVEAAIHWPGMVPESHPFGAIPGGEEPTDD